MLCPQWQAHYGQCPELQQVGTEAPSGPCYPLPFLSSASHSWSSSSIWFPCCSPPLPFTPFPACQVCKIKCSMYLRLLSRMGLLPWLASLQNPGFNVSLRHEICSGSHRHSCRPTMQIQSTLPDNRLKLPLKRRGPRGKGQQARNSPTPDKSVPLFSKGQSSGEPSFPTHCHVFTTQVGRNAVWSS